MLLYLYSHADDVCKILLIQLLFSSTCKWYGKRVNRKLIALLLKLCNSRHFQGRGCVCVWSNISFLQTLKEGVCVCCTEGERLRTHWPKKKLKKFTTLNPPFSLIPQKKKKALLSACWLASFVANNFYAHFYYASNGQCMFHDVPHVIILMMQVLMIDIPFWAYGVRV